MLDSVRENTTNLEYPVLYQQRPHFIDDDARLVLVASLTIGTIIVSVFGIASNIVNIVVFCKSGVRDSMTVALVAQSISDLACSIFACATCICGFTLMVGKINLINIPPISYMISQQRDIFYVISCAVTSYLAVERCFCVIVPFKVKSIFTKTVSIIAMISLTLIIYGFHSPMFFIQTLVWRNISFTINDEAYSFRKLEFVYKDDWEVVFLFVNSSSSALSTLCQVVVILATVLMIFGLLASSKVRTAASASKESSSKLSLKEKRLVKMIIFLALILTVCNLPKYASMLASYYIDLDMNNSKAYENLFMFLFSLAWLFGAINTSVNVFVYLAVNISYRNTMMAVFGISCAQDKQ